MRTPFLGIALAFLFTGAPAFAAEVPVLACSSQVSDSELTFFSDEEGYSLAFTGDGSDGPRFRILSQEKNLSRLLDERILHASTEGMGGYTHGNVLVDAAMITVARVKGQRGRYWVNVAAYSSIYSGFICETISRPDGTGLSR